MQTLRWLLAWLAAVVVTGGLGSVVQTQLNLRRLTGLGVEIDIGTRLGTTFDDLWGFAPTWCIIVALGLLVGLLVAGALAGRLPRWRPALFGLAGFVAPLTALLVMDAMLPVTPVAAARTWTGVILMSLPGLLGGWVYGRMRAQSQNGQNFHQAAQRNSSLHDGS